MKSSNRATPSLEIVLAICCAALGVVAVFLALAGGLNSLGGTDYRVYLTAGKMVLERTGAHFYDLPTQFAVQRELWPAMTSQRQLLPFLAPPFVALFFAPLALLPVMTGYVVWTVFNAVLLWFIARALLEITGLQGSKRLVAIALMLTFAPLIFTLMQGQVSLLVVLAWWQSYQNLKLKRDFRGGLWLALALIRPQMLVLPLLIFAWKRRWNALGGWTLGALILAIASLILVGFDGLIGYKNLLGAVAGWQSGYGVQPQSMQTWRGFLHAAFRTDAAEAVRVPWILGVAAATAALFWGWRGAWQTESPRFERQWAMLGFAALFCCPYLYSHDLSLLLLCGALLCGAARQEKSRLLLLPLFGYAAVTAWAVLLTVRPPVPSLAVFFEGASLLWLSRFSGRE